MLCGKQVIGRAGRIRFHQSLEGNCCSFLQGGAGLRGKRGKNVKLFADFFLYLYSFCLGKKQINQINKQKVFGQQS